MTAACDEGAPVTGGPAGLWGKWADGPTVHPYPLIAHLLDTAAVATTMWAEWVSEPLKRRLSQSCAVAVEDAGASYIWLAGSHDLGKADPVFQGQLLAKNQQDPRFRDYLNKSGLPLPSLDWQHNIGAVLGDARAHLRHEAVTGDVLNRLGAPDVVSAVLAGHHGRYPCYPASGQYHRVREHRNFLAGSEWRQQHMRILATLADALGPPPAESIRDLPGDLIPLMSGLVILADWLASDETFVESSPTASLKDPAEYYQLRSSQAHKHLSTRLGFPVPRAGTFHELFGFEPSRPVQQWAVSETNPSGLTIVAVPMGEGKTETALWLHSLAAGSREGLVFALPTTATTDAMFERIRSFYGNTASLAQLSHGRAILNAFYPTSDNRAVSVCDDESGLTSSDWFAGRHRALVAPVTASTCDQLLAAAVSHKYIAVRFASMANKHVILDEVHTYDPYQDCLLERALTWLGAFGARVTLLSATLPTRRLNSYLNAYAAGAGIPTGDAEPSGTYPAVTTLTGAGVHQHMVDSSRRYEHGIQIEVISGQGPVTERTVHCFRLLAADPGRTGLIVNTVDRAIAVAKQLRDHFPNVILLHSRMTAAQRERATGSVLTLCGKDAPPGSVQVVATQIAEASLDLDFDVLVTDLAPMTSLLQRMGRQWRHSQPHPNGSWTHRPGFEYRRHGPVIHILCQLTPSSEPDKNTRFPYSQAELVKTWQTSQALNRGRRTSLAIPDDLQAAVDSADVSFDDLATDDVTALPEDVLLDHMANQLRAQSLADAIGVSAAQVRDGWERDEEWEQCDALARLTHGDMWHADATTRLRDSFTIEMLPCDPSGANRHSWPHSPESLLAVRDRSDEIAVLRHAIPVSGKLASQLKQRSTIGQTDAWKRHPGALMRSLTPLDVNDVSGLCELTDFGLEKAPNGQPA